MGIWVVVLEAVQGPDDGPGEIGPDDLDAFAEECRAAGATLHEPEMAAV